MTNSLEPAPRGQGSADHAEIIRQFVEGIINTVEKTYPLFGELPMCPFARQARIKGKIKFVVHPFDLDDEFTELSFFARETDLWLAEPRSQMLLFIDSDATLPFKSYMNFYTRFEAFAATRACHAFPGHPEHPFEIRGIRTQNERYPNIQLISLALLEEKRHLLRGTRWYDTFTHEELDSMGVPR